MSAAGTLFAQAAARQDWTAAAAALSQLCALAKKQAQREALQKELRRDALHAALACPEPKARKNAARLLSASRRAAVAAKSSSPERALSAVLRA